MSGADDVALVIPTLDEAETLPRLARLVAAFVFAPAEVLVVDGGSANGTAALARQSRAPTPVRAYVTLRRTGLGKK